MTRSIKYQLWDGEMMRAVFSIVFREDNSYLVNDEFVVPGKDGAVLRQSTGLLDKSGMEIFEGDIVRCFSRRRCPHEVMWMEAMPSTNIGGAPGFYLTGLNEGYGFGGEEVIGNIYQNPELLKV
jgi:hypothetical protein